LSDRTVHSGPSPNASILFARDHGQTSRHSASRAENCFLRLSRHCSSSYSTRSSSSQKDNGCVRLAPLALERRAPTQPACRERVYPDRGIIMIKNIFKSSSLLCLVTPAREASRPFMRFALPPCLVTFARARPWCAKRSTTIGQVVTTRTGRQAFSSTRAARRACIAGSKGVGLRLSRGRSKFSWY